MSTDKSQADTLKTAIIESAVEQVRALLESNFREVQKAAIEGFTGDENKTEPTAKASVTIEWGALATAPKVHAKLGWSVRFADESEEEIDPLQSKLGLESAADGLVKTLRKHGATMVVKTEDRETVIK